MTDLIDHQDDDESYADDDPADLLYRLPLDRYRDILTAQLASVAGRMKVDFDHEAFIGKLQARALPKPGRSGKIEITRDGFHAKVQDLLDELGDGQLRARVANEVLVLAGAMHEGTR